MADGLTSDDRRTALVALRDFLAASLAEADVANRAALAKQYRDTVNELGSLGSNLGGDEVDEIAQRRSAKATVPSRSAGAGKRRARGG